MRLNTNKTKTTRLSKDFRGFPTGEGYLEDVPLIKAAILEALEDFEFTSDGFSPDIEENECRSRDGFIAFSHNKGGFDKNNCLDLYSIWSSGRTYSDKKLNTLVQKYIEQALKDAIKDFIDANPDILKHGIKIEDIGYYSLVDAGLDSEAEMLSEKESDYLQGDYNEIKEQVRIMYHGKQHKTHSLTVFASISVSDAPYHRSSDAIKEVLVTFKTVSELKKKLPKALAKAGSIFE